MKNRIETMTCLLAALAMAACGGTETTMTTPAPNNSGGGGGGGGGGGTTTTQSSAVVYSDLVGLYRIADGTTTELGTGPDYRALTKLARSPDGGMLLHVVGRDLRVTSTADGGVVLTRQAGHVPFGWLDAETILAGAPGAGLGTIGAVVRISMDGTSAPAFDLAGKEYCTAGAHAVSPDGTKVILRCGYGNDGELVLGDLGAGIVSGHGETKITQSGTPPIWLANGHVVHIGDDGMVHVDAATLDAPMALSIPADSILRAGPNAVLVMAKTTGAGGLDIHGYTIVEIPSGATTDLAWLAEANPSFEKVVVSVDGTRVLFADGNGIFSAALDGSDRVELKEKKEGRLAIPLQSIAW